MQGIAVESTFNWYWLVDGLRDAGFQLKLVNTAAVKQYDGLKYRDEQHDAFWLAHLMRLRILPTGYIYPQEQRAVRDLLRRRLSLVRAVSTQLISVQSQIWRSTGIRIATGELKKPMIQISLAKDYAYQAVEMDLAVYQAIRKEIDQPEQTTFSVHHRNLQAPRPSNLRHYSQRLRARTAAVKKSRYVYRFPNLVRCSHGIRV